MIGVHKLSPAEQFLVSTLSSRIRNIKNARGNFNIMSTNNSHLNIRGFTENLYKMFTKYLSSTYTRNTTAYRIFLRKINDIASNKYAERQRFHINESRSPGRGEAYIQFIYFLETPQRNGRNAPVNDRGTLALTSNGRTREIVPEKGTLVFFSPGDTFHEVIEQENPDAGSVSRNMIIGMLYRTPRNNVTVNRQVRLNEARARTTRAILGRQPLSSTLSPPRNVNNIIRRLQGVTIKRKKQSPPKKRIPIKSTSRSVRPKTSKSSRRNEKLKEKRAK